MQYAIHNGKGTYLSKSPNWIWTDVFKLAKIYKSKPAMFKRLIQLMEQYPSEVFYFETIEVSMKSKGSQTLGAYNRIKKVNSITSNINRIKYENSKKKIS